MAAANVQQAAGSFEAAAIAFAASSGSSRKDAEGILHSMNNHPQALDVAQYVLGAPGPAVMQAVQPLHETFRR